MQRMPRIALIAFSLLLVCMLAVPGVAFAKKKKKKSYRHDPYETVEIDRFAVPFICGENARSTDRVALGNYSATINILNLSTEDAELRARVLLAFPPVTPGPGFVSMTRGIQVGPGQALQFDCAEIGLVEFPDPVPDTPYVFGFLQLQTRASVRVWVTQSAGTDTGGITLQTQQVESERVEVRRRRDGSDERIICHVPPGNPDNAHEIVIDESSVDAHLRHGDYEGYCRDEREDDWDEDD